MKTLKKILKENENEFSGNLPIYRNDLNTSIAFQVLTNQIVVVEIKNHKPVSYTHLTLPTKRIV